MDEAISHRDDGSPWNMKTLSLAFVPYPSVCLANDLYALHQTERPHGIPTEIRRSMAFRELDCLARRFEDMTQPNQGTLGQIELRCLVVPPGGNTDQTRRGFANPLCVRTFCRVSAQAGPFGASRWCGQARTRRTSTSLSGPKSSRSTEPNSANLAIWWRRQSSVIRSSGMSKLCLFMASYPLSSAHILTRSVCPPRTRGRSWQPDAEVATPLGD
jgi:hypothetical protein